MTTHLVTHSSIYHFTVVEDLKARHRVACCLLRVSQGQNQDTSQSPLALVGLRCLISCWLWSGSPSPLLEATAGSQSCGTLRIWQLTSSKPVRDSYSSVLWWSPM